MKIYLKDHTSLFSALDVSLDVSFPLITELTDFVFHGGAHPTKGALSDD